MVVIAPSREISIVDVTLPTRVDFESQSLDKTIAENPVLSRRKARLFEHRSGGARQIRNEVCADGHHIDCRVVFHEFSEQRQFDLARTAGHPPKMNNRGVTGV